VAQAIMNVITNPVQGKTIIALGGPHYLPNFTNKLVDTDIAIGHACPKHHIHNLTKELLQQAIDKTIPKPEMVLLDWKGLGPNKGLIRELSETCPIPVERLERFSHN
jgi:D-tyrosyl-tRNA(Tyr) deacylase